MKTERGQNGREMPSMHREIMQPLGSNSANHLGMTGTVATASRAPLAATVASSFARRLEAALVERWWWVPGVWRDRPGLSHSDR
jgi:hypothetical protein